MIWDVLSDSLLQVWEILTFWKYPVPALPHMRLSPNGGDDNALVVSVQRGLYHCAGWLTVTQFQFFTWDCSHPHMSWWRHFESEVPNLAALGVTQVWLPPPNKAMRKVSFCLYLAIV